MSYATAANPCGSQTYGEVEDYSVNIKAPTFITAVVPASGFVAPGGTQPVNVYFSATDDYSPAGVYVNQLALESNDLANPAVNITCTMTVYIPGTISGVVTDGVSGDLLPGVMVDAGGFTAMTGDNGEYSLVLQAGTYNLTFSKIGYQNAISNGVVVTAGNATTVDAQLFEMPYAPSCATAVVNAEDTQSTVTWCVPAGPYELLYDDGTAENFAAWQLPGNMNAVKFTPKGYPAHVVGAKLFVGDGSFPAGGVVNGAEFGVAVYSADANGMPGMMLDSVPASVTNFGWVNVTGLNALVNTGDFFIVMIQGSMSPDCAPIGVDETQPKAFKSYSRNVGTNSPWVLSPYQDFMMHAVVSGPMSGDDAMEVAANVVPGKVAGMISQSKPMAVAGQTGMSAMVTAPEGYDNMDMVHHYSLSRISLGPVTPVAPAAGVFTLLNNNITATTYTEGGTTWSALPQGWYAYGVKAVYPNAQESEFVYTNAVPHKMFADVTVNVDLVCGFVPAEGAFVSLTGNDYPYDVYSATVPASGTVFFDNVIKGVYDLLVTRAGYYATGYKVTINGDKTIDVVLEDLRYMPRNLMVDCGTLVATWDEPLAIAVQEDFEGGVFPPAGWQATTQGSVGWYATTDGGSAYFAIPGHTTYAVANDDEGGSANNGSVDYLITPELDLTGAPSYVLSFQSFYTGDFGQMAFVEMSTDAGASWTPIYTCSPAATWQQVDVDLSAYSGASGLGSVWFTFHADDAGQWASGWAIDDVMIASGGVPVQGYGVFLDATEVAQTQELTYTFNPGTITYGQTYVAGVAGLYCSGYSDLETYTFTSCFLYPPRNLEGVFNGSTTSGAAILTWEAPLGGDSKIDASQTASVTGAPAEAATVGSTFVSTSTGASNNTDATVLYDNGTIVNSPGTGPGGSDESVIPAGGSTYGNSMNQAGGYSIADDFVVVANMTISQIAVQGYQTNSGNTSTFTGLYARIYNGDPQSGGTVIWGDLTTNLMTETNFANIYRVTAPGEGTARPVMNIIGSGLNIALTPGTYWIEYATTGTVASGPWVPNTVALNGAGSKQWQGTAWAAYVNPGPVDVPFILSGGGASAGNLLSYNLYRDDAVVASIPKEELTYWDLNLMPATYCYDITAVYDIEPYGFPAGSTGESVKEGTACVDVMYGFELPFMEDWTTGQFDVNLWTVGDNWIMDGQAGNEMPSAKFKWDPLLTDYSSSLESFYMNAAAINTTTPYKIWLDFDLKLDDRTASTMEMLTIEVWNGSSWSEVKEYTNNGDFDWTEEHINISSAAKGNVFKVRFRANGDLTGDIFYWAVDNIHIYVGYEFMPPLNLVATSEGTPKNDIKLTWSAPEGGGTVMTYVLDDNSAENGWGINAGADAWLGNEFVVTENGVLQSLDLYFQTNAASGNYPMTVDIFDASQTLVGTSASFVPVADNWVTVALNDVPFNGTFYAMLHWNLLPGSSHWFGSDENGPNAAANYGWYYDGAAWAHLSDFGYPPNVFLIRAKALVGGDKAVATFGPSSISDGGSASAAALLSKSDVSSSAGVPVSSSAIYLGDNSDALTGYNVWRRAYAVFPAGQNTAAAGDFVKINTAIVVPTEYLDMNLSNLETNCYEYQVTAVYSEGESAPSNIDWECIFVGVDPNAANEVKVYPNPATTYVRIDLTKEVTQISVYNSLGAVVADKNVKGETTITLNTANYAAGAYSVKFTTASGESFSRKFVVTK
jgi:primosomal replication protein N